MILFSSPFLAIYSLVLCICAGLVMGSALNCLAWRMAHGEKWSGGRSHCPSCGHVLTIRDLIPVFSWLSQKGKCRYCKAKVSVRYPLSELGLAVIYVSLLLAFDLSLETLQYLLLASCLFCLSLVDLEIQEIPDRFLILPAVTRLLYQFFLGGGLSAVWNSLWHGLLVGGILLAFVLLMDKVLGKESMGGGDIKLLAMLALYFPLPGVLLLVFTAALVGIVLALAVGAKKGIAFPFGPAISLAAWLVLLFGDPLIRWYLSLF